jgi:putative transposase
LATAPTPEFTTDNARPHSSIRAAACPWRDLGTGDACVAPSGRRTASRSFLLTPFDPRCRWPRRDLRTIRPPHRKPFIPSEAHPPAAAQAIHYCEGPSGPPQRKPFIPSEANPAFGSQSGRRSSDSYSWREPLPMAADGQLTLPGNHSRIAMMRLGHQHRPDRHSIRLPEFDYRWNAAYFVTICTHQRAWLFGTVERGRMHLNDCGHIAASAWRQIADHFPGVTLDAWVVMPNHVHGIIVLTGNQRPPVNVAVIAWRKKFSATDYDPDGSARPKGPARKSLGAIVGSFKSATTRSINQRRRMPRAPVWQRGYHESIVGEGRSLDAIRRYIATNPRHWLQPKQRHTRPVSRT